MEDLKNWTKVLETLDTILLEAGGKLNTCNKILLMEDDVNSKEVACKVLKFLSLLLKASSDKRYFLSIEVQNAQLFFTHIRLYFRVLTLTNLWY